MNPTYFLTEDCQVQESKEGAIGYFYQLGGRWMAHSNYKAKGKKCLSRQDAIAYLAKCA
jgi:hypothetical protein